MPANGAESTFALNLAHLPGDVNGDGEVNVADATAFGLYSEAGAPVERRGDAHRLARADLLEQCETAVEIARRRHTDVRSLARKLRGELEWITMRALEKDPDRRYQSAADLALDVQRFLDALEQNEENLPLQRARRRNAGRPPPEKDW